MRGRVGVRHRYNSVCSPGLSKNVITVGATYSYQDRSGIDYVTDYSSRGSQTGRLKPDVCSVGTMMSAQSLSPRDCGTSCNNHDGVVSMQGTYPECNCLRFLHPRRWRLPPFQQLRERLSST